MERGNENGRAWQMFWMVTDEWDIVQAKGYECPPNDGIWWFPTLGFSTSKTFATQAEALEDAHRRLDQFISALCTKRDGLKQYEGG